MPDWLAFFESDLKKQLAPAAARGAVTLGLRITRDEASAGLQLNTDTVDQVLSAIAAIEERAGATGVTLTPASAATVLGFRGVMDAPQHSAAQPEELAELAAALTAQVPELLAAFTAMRRAEGAALHAVLTRQLGEIEDLTDQAHALLGARAAEIKANFKTALARIMDSGADLDEARMAQEIATLAVKSDVTEEIDRLRAHIAAARTLLASADPVGRKFDFLCQEFNREANTLCSKAQHAGLTEIGLALKVLIDQMREQVQNVE
jgi:uncharacterized protein (TIGR00255 family)